MFCEGKVLHVAIAGICKMRGRIKYGKVLRIGVLVLLLFLTASFVYAQERGTKDEARALIKKSVALIKAEGPEREKPFLRKDRGDYRLGRHG